MGLSIKTDPCARHGRARFGVAVADECLHSEASDTTNRPRGASRERGAARTEMLCVFHEKCSRGQRPTDARGQDHFKVVM